MCLHHFIFVVAELASGDVAFILHCESSLHTVQAARLVKLGSTHHRQQKRRSQRDARDKKVFDGMMNALLRVRAAGGGRVEEPATPPMAEFDERSASHVPDSYLSLGGAGGAAVPWFSGFGQFVQESRVDGGPVVQQYVITAEHLLQMWAPARTAMGDLNWIDIFPVHNLTVDMHNGASWPCCDWWFVVCGILICVVACRCACAVFPRLCSRPYCCAARDSVCFSCRLYCEETTRVGRWCIFFSIS